MDAPTNTDLLFPKAISNRLCAEIAARLRQAYKRTAQSLSETPLA
jgi:hypothetical protein